MRRRTLEDNTEAAFADFLAHSVVSADDALSRTGVVVGVYRHPEEDEKGKEMEGQQRERNINTVGDTSSARQSPQLMP